jgi:hypothetical protein
MPNGGDHTKKEWREIETFFEKISQTLNQFATKFNLAIDKYYHEGADWTFRFTHPLGGNGHIQVMKAGTESVWLALGWYKDDYDSFTRSVKYDTWKDVPLEPIQLFGSLEKALKTILSWKLGEWTEWSEDINILGVNIANRNGRRCILSILFPKSKRVPNSISNRRRSFGPPPLSSIVTS